MHFTRIKTCRIHEGTIADPIIEQGGRCVFSHLLGKEFVNKSRFVSEATQGW